MARKESVMLIRPGASEHKRTDLAYSYLQIANSVNNEIKGKHWEKDKVEIFNHFKLKGIYKKSKTKIELNREKSLIKKLNLIKEDENISPTRLAIEYSNSINEEENNFVYGMSKDEFDFMQIFLFDDFNVNRQGFLILEKLLNKEEYRWVINEKIKEELSEGNFDYVTNVIRADINFSSGSPNKSTVNFKGEEYTMSQAKNLISDTWLNDSITCIKGEKKEGLNILEMISHFSKGFQKNPYDFIKDTILHLITPINISEKKKRELKNNIIKTIKYEGIFPNEFDDLLSRIIERCIGGSINSYENLIKNHLRFIIFVGEDENGFYIKPEYEDIVKMIILNQEQLINEFKLSEYVNREKFIKIINSNEINIEANHEKIYDIYLQEYGTLEKITSLLQMFDITKFSSEFEMREKISKYISDSKHINGICSQPAFYEFVIGIAILIKHKNIFELNSKDFISVVRNSLNLKFKTDKLTPYLHAPGRRPDINVEMNEGDIIVEPTIQLERQTSMEADSIKSHVNSYERKISEVIFVSPSIENEIQIVFKAWLEGGIISNEVKSFSTNDFINYIVNK